MKEFDPEELGRFSGKDGTPVYISLEGKVYDVSGSELWETGTHMARHNAGRALDDEFGAAPHGQEVLERVPQVGILKAATPGPAEAKGPEEAAKGLIALLDRYPFLKRHPHPMVVHFPIGLIMASLVFGLAYIVTGIPSLRTTSLQVLVLGILSLPFAIGTGYLNWRTVYLGKPIRQVKIKKGMSWPLLGFSMLTLWVESAWSPAPDAVYTLLLCILAAMVSAIGYFGGQLTIGRA